MHDDARKFKAESKDADLRSSDQDDAAGYFGDCPICHKNDGYVNVGNDHWFICVTHKKKWGIGANLFSSAMDETPERQLQEQESLGFDSFEIVEPFYPPPPPARDVTDTHEQKEKQMNFSDEKQRQDDPILVEHQPSATAPLTAVSEEKLEDLDISFDDPTLEAAAERESRRSRENLEHKFEALQLHLSYAAKIAIQIKALVREDPA
jgi:hypothetical protein